MLHIWNPSRENRNGWLSCNSVPTVMKRCAHRLMAGRSWKDTLAAADSGGVWGESFSTSFCTFAFCPSDLAQQMPGHSLYHLKFANRVHHKHLSLFEEILNAAILSSYMLMWLCMEVWGEKKGKMAICFRAKTRLHCLRASKCKPSNIFIKCIKALISERALARM